MHKYATGQYVVYIFDRYGGKLRDKTMTAQNYTQARLIGEENKAEGSYVAVRVIYNSLDPHPTVVGNLPDDD